MPRFRVVKERLAMRLGLPRDAMLALPRVSLEGNRRVEVTGHKGVVTFSPVRVDFSTNTGVLSVIGQELIIDQIGLESAYVSGTVSCVAFDYDKNSR